MTPHLRGKLQKFAAVALTGGVVAAVSLAATEGLAQGRSQATIVLHASVTTIGPNGKATITAVVRPGSLVPLGGRVTFVNRTRHKTLGSALLRTHSGALCTARAKSCRAKLRVSARKLDRGANRIVGLFNPHKLYYPTFSAATLLYRGVTPKLVTPAAGTTCRSPSQPVFTGGPIAYAAASGSSLCRGKLSSGHTNVTVSSRQRLVVTRHTVVAFGSQRLPCSTRHTGVLLAFSISGRQTLGAIELQVVGHEAVIAHRAHPHGYICYESTKRFRTASGHRARRTANGLYYGALPYCRNNEADDVYPPPATAGRPRHAPPCIEWELFSHRHGEAVWTVWFEPTTGDPRSSW